MCKALHIFSININIITGYYRFG